MRRLLLLVALIPLVGCNDAKLSESPNYGGDEENAPRQVQDALRQNEIAAARKPGLGGAGPEMGPAGVDGVPAKVAGQENKAPVEPPVARKIIYTGRVDLIVTDFDRASQQVAKLGEENGGYVANSKLEATVGDRRKATWTLRVPVANFRTVMDAAGRLGHVITTHTDSQDVTDEFFDIEARLKTKQDEEKSLRELLTKSTDKLENLLAIRRELARVREEIESAQGRLNKLSKLSELTTITITLQERKDYVPPTAPTFGGRVGNTFSDSASALVNFLKAVALTLVALVPWLPVILVGVGVPVLGLRWLVRSSNRQAPAVAPAPVVPPADQPRTPS